MVEYMDPDRLKGIKHPEPVNPPAEPAGPGTWRDEDLQRADKPSGKLPPPR